MIFALILILLIFIFLAFFVGKNLSNICTFWFFKTYTDLSVTVIVFIAFAAGIIFSLLCYLVAKLIRSSHESEVADARKLGLKEQKKKEKLEKKTKKSSVESQAKPADKVNIEDRIHE